MSRERKSEIETLLDMLCRDLQDLDLSLDDRHAICDYAIDLHKEYLKLSDGRKYTPKGLNSIQSTVYYDDKNNERKKETL